MVTVAERCPRCMEVFEHEVEDRSPAPPTGLEVIEAVMRERIPEAKRLCPRCRARESRGEQPLDTPWGDKILGAAFVTSATIMMLAVAIWFFRWLVGV
jgi:hypothetical protein